MWSYVTRISAEQRQANLALEAAHADDCYDCTLIHEAHRTNGQAVHLLLGSHDLPLMREPAETLAGSCAKAAKIGLKARESCANHARDYGKRPLADDTACWLYTCSMAPEPAKTAHI